MEVHRRSIFWWREMRRFSHYRWRYMWLLYNRRRWWRRTVYHHTKSCWQMEQVNSRVECSSSLKNTNVCIILTLHIMKVRDVQFTIGTIFDQWQNIERNRSRKWVLICCRAYNFSTWFRWRVLLYQHFISIDVDWQRNLYGFEHSVPKVSLTTKLEVKALIRVRGKEATRTIARAMKFQRQVVMNHISTGLFFNRWMKHTRSWTMVLYFKFTILNPHSRKYLQLSMIMMSMKTLQAFMSTSIQKRQ